MTVDYTKLPLRPGAPPSTQKPKAGCGTFAVIGCAVVLALMLITGGGIAVFVFRLIKSTDVYREAVRRAQSNPQVIAVLGSPVEPKWWVLGSINVTTEGGKADLSIPIEGPEGDARIHAEATRERRQWRFTSLVVKPERGEPIDLMR